MIAMEKDGSMRFLERVSARLRELGADGRETDGHGVKEDGRGANTYGVTQGTPPRFVVALSGGADSVALLCALSDLGYVVYAYHLNHALRGESADADEAYCRKLCGDSGIPFYSEKIDITARAAQDRTSFEDAGRKARYEGLARLASSLSDASSDLYIATGHHAGDVAETFFINALRGAGLPGLCSIEPISEYARISTGLCGLPGESEPPLRVIRPFLGFQKSELQAYLVSRGTKWQEDDTNQCDAYLRNRIRKLLDEPSIGKILDCIRLLKRDRDFFDRHTEMLFERYVRRIHRRRGAAGSGGGENAPDALLLVNEAAELHEAEFSRLVRLIALKIGGTLLDFTSQNVAAVARLGRTGAAVEIGTAKRRLYVYRSYDGWEFERRTEGGASAGEAVHVKMNEASPKTKDIKADNSCRNREDAGGIAPLREAGSDETIHTEMNGVSGKTDDAMCVGGMLRKTSDMRGDKSSRNRGDAGVFLEDVRPEAARIGRIRFRETDRASSERVRGSGANRIVVDMDKIKGTLRVRSRAEGDEIAPLGMKGKKTLKKLMIDEKIDRRIRGSVPIVTDEEKIIWVAGIRMSDEVRTERMKTKRFGILELVDFDREAY